MNILDINDSEKSEFQKFVTITIITVILYSISLYYSLILSPLNNAFSIFFLPAGIAAGLSILYGYKIAYIVFITKLIMVTIIKSESGMVALLSTSLASGLEAMTAYYVSKVYTERSKIQSQNYLTIIIALFAPIIPAFFGIWNKGYSGSIEVESYFLNFYTYYSGDALAIMIIVPLILNIHSFKDHKVLDFIAPLISLLFAYAFNFNFSSPFSILILFTILLPGVFGTKIGISLSAIVATIYLNSSAISSLGSYNEIIVQNAFMRLQIFILAIALFTMGIAELRKMKLINLAYRPLFLMWVLIGIVFFYNYQSNLGQNDIFSDYKIRNIKNIFNEKINNLKLITISHEALINSSNEVTQSEWKNFEESLRNDIEFNLVKFIGTSIYDPKEVTQFFVSSTDNNLSESKIRELLEINFFEQFYFKSSSNSDIMISPIQETYGIDGKKYEVIFMIKSNKVGNKLKSLSILGFDISKLISTSISDYSDHLDLDIYEISNTGSDKLIYSKRSSYSKYNLDDNPQTKISYLKILNANYRIKYNDAYRAVVNSENVNPLIILVGALITFLLSSFFSSKKMISSRALNEVYNSKLIMNEYNKKFDLLLRSTEDAVIIFSLEEILDANDAALDLFKMTSLAKMKVHPPLELLSLRDSSDMADSNLIHNKLLEANLNDNINFHAFILSKTLPVYSQISIGKFLINDIFVYMMVINVKKSNATNIMASKFIRNSSTNESVSQHNDEQIPVSPSVDNNIESTEAPIFNQQRVLLVDDNEINIMMSKKYLEKWGLKVDTAKNGKIAVSMALNFDYAVILMDIHMPVMDGYEATRIIRQKNQKVPIIGLSADVINNLSEANYFVKFTDFIPKPFRVDDFLSKMKYYIK